MNPVDNESAIYAVCEPFTVLCFAARTSVIRALIPQGTIGTYALFKQGVPFYVGRSDRCLAVRLALHEKLDQATHFIWAPTRTILQAYYQEAAWYHQLSADGFPLNKIHPRKPKWHRQVACPFCNVQKA